MGYENRKKEIGKRLKAMREERGMSKKEVLSCIYLSESSHKSLSAWEAGERLPDLESLARMAELFDCDIGYLLGDYEQKKRRSSDVVSELGLSPLAAANLVAIKEHSNGVDFWAETLQFLSFLLERSSSILVPIACDAANCISEKLDMKYYQIDVLPTLSRPDDEEDIEWLYKRTKVYDEIKRLKDVSDAKLYHCEKASSDAIAEYIEQEVERLWLTSRNAGTSPAS